MLILNHLKIKLVDIFNGGQKSSNATTNDATSVISEPRPSKSANIEESLSPFHMAMSNFDPNRKVRLDIRH